jgi:pimeloyl-ACP methyl ester carboxylesterase
MSTPSAFPFTPPLPSAAFEYWTDAWQRTILFWDVLRERGNQYLEHEQFGKPPVLVFDYEIIVDARKLDRPANYALAAIVPSADCPPTDPKKRPFVVIDPRAGHGPGIGGFKMDSEIGIALKQGHPCYFVMFFPQPVEGQTVECVTYAERVFLNKVNELHPQATGKPFVIGNCQGGWALMILAALAPDSVGPILLAGSPIAYWAGVAGKHPLRYMGGLLGGTWTASFTGDLGNGKFDGAYLVNNFEQLDPGNTYWRKLYNLYAEVDTERERFLEFERWWGGHFILNKEEMEWITQNLFVGNRLSAGEIPNEEGKVRVNLRNIRSPIVVFASWGDNITPPQQALNWIADLYDNVEEIRDNEQTIVYFLHEHVGHLGIFVSSGVANREHSEFASALDLIDVLPPGLYEAVIFDTHPEMPGLEYADGRYVIRFEPRDVSDILALDDGREDERPFEVVRRVAQINQALYDSFVSPFVRMFSNEYTAACWRNLNPARFERTLLSDSNPVLNLIKPVAQQVREQRKPVEPDNPWLQAEHRVAEAIGKAWDTYRDRRDASYERVFKAVYESPLLAAVVGFKPEQLHEAKPRVRTWEQDEMLRLKHAEHEAWFKRGSPETGFLRLLIYVAIGSGVVDERPFNGIKRVMRDIGLDKTVTLEKLKATIKRQTFLVRMDQERALATLPNLLPEKHQRHQALELARELLALGGPISAEKEQRLARVAQVLEYEPAEVTASPPANAVAEAAVKPKARRTRSATNQRAK